MEYINIYPEDPLSSQEYKSIKSYKVGGLPPIQRYPKERDQTNWDLNLSTDNSCPSKILIFLFLQIYHIKHDGTTLYTRLLKDLGLQQKQWSNSQTSLQHNPFHSKKYKDKGS